MGGHREAPILAFSTGDVRTPPDRVPVPRPDVEGKHDLDRPEYYLNRELTWLNFTFRVLNLAEDARTPLLERVKFLAIVGSNLDEFFMKRIGGLKQQVGAGIHDLTIDGRTPGQQIDESLELIRELNLRERKVLLELTPQLEQHGIRLVEWGELSPDDQQYLRKQFIDNYYPLLTPQATDPAHPFPFISNLSLNLLVRLRYPDNPAPNLARVKVPVGVGVPRLLKLEDSHTFVRLESVMAANLDLLFPGMEIDSVARFRVTRNANTERDEEKADDLLALIESELRDRKFAPVVRLEVSPDLSPQLRAMLTNELGLDEHVDLFEVGGMMGTRDLMELVDLPFASLRYPQLHPVDHPALGADPNIFNVIRESKQVLLHHPYVSFTTSVERFLREASKDPEVRAIKMSLYRTSSDTKAIEYLIDAAQNGKQVAVVVELKARFDEQANIRWASRLEEAGIHVTYGVVGLKTHCKAIPGRAARAQEDPPLLAHRHRQLPRRYGASVHRPGSVDLGPEDRRGPDRAVQLPDHGLQAEAHLQATPAVAQGAAHGAAREDRPRDLEAHQEGPGPDPVQDERAGGPGHHARPLPRSECRRARRPDRARFLPPASGRPGPVGERARDQHRRPVPGARAHHLLQERRRRGIRHRLGRPDAPQPLEPRRDPGARSRTRRCRRSCAASSTCSSRTAATPGRCSPTAATCS